MDSYLHALIKDTTTLPSR